MFIPGMSGIDSLMSQSYTALTNIHQITDSLRATKVSHRNGLFPNLSGSYPLVDLSLPQLVDLSSKMPVTSSQDFLSGKLPLDYYSQIMSDINPDYAYDSSNTDSSLNNSISSSIAPSININDLFGSNINLASLFKLILSNNATTKNGDDNTPDATDTQADKATTTTSSTNNDAEATSKATTEPASNPTPETSLTTASQPAKKTIAEQRQEIRHNIQQKRQEVRANMRELRKLKGK